MLEPGETARVLRAGTSPPTTLRGTVIHPGFKEGCWPGRKGTGKEVWVSGQRERKRVHTCVCVRTRARGAESISACRLCVCACTAGYPACNPEVPLGGHGLLPCRANSGPLHWTAAAAVRGRPSLCSSLCGHCGCLLNAAHGGCVCARVCVHVRVCTCVCVHTHTDTFPSTRGTQARRNPRANSSRCPDPAWSDGHLGPPRAGVCQRAAIWRHGGGAGSPEESCMSPHPVSTTPQPAAFIPH